VEDDAKLLLRMSEPESNFIQGLKLFQLHAYGNLVGDTLVPFETACICDSASAQLHALHDDARVPVPAASVAVGQLVRVMYPHTSDRPSGDSTGNSSSSGGSSSSSSSCCNGGEDGGADVVLAIRNNLRSLPWNTCAINLNGWLAPHNAICNKGLSQTLGISRQTVVLDDIVRCLADATGMRRVQRNEDTDARGGNCSIA
jgi:hypothetical protein